MIFPLEPGATVILYFFLFKKDKSNFGMSADESRLNFFDAVLDYSSSRFLRSDRFIKFEKSAESSCRDSTSSICDWTLNLAPNESWLLFI